MRRTISAVAVALMVALFSLPVHAQEPIEIQVNNGFINFFHPIHVFGDFRFVGQDVDIIGQLQAGDGNVSPTCSPCVAGQQTSVGAQVNSLTFGRATINGDDRKYWLTYNFFIQTPGLVIPYFRAWMPFTFVLPATLTGNVGCWNGHPNVTANPKYIAPLKLVGTVKLTLVNSGSPLNPNTYSPSGSPFYSVVSIVYEFPSLTDSLDDSVDR